MVKELKRAKSSKSQDLELSKEIPQLIMTQMPHAGANDGMYEVIIPLEYVLAALKAPAAFFVFKFVGLKERLK